MAASSRVVRTRNFWLTTEYTLSHLDFKQSLTKKTGGILSTPVRAHDEGARRKSEDSRRGHQYPGLVEIYLFTCKRGGAEAILDGPLSRTIGLLNNRDSGILVQTYH